MFECESLSNKGLFAKIKNKKITFGGNRNLKIYGTLRCQSGKRLKRPNRVFFASEQDALAAGYRPCGHCLKPKYKAWIYSKTIPPKT